MQQASEIEQWFELNKRDVTAADWLYTDIPHHYTYAKNEWKKRQRGGEKIVARMYTVSPKEEELFYLRMLLLHVRGATSFESLRTFDNTTQETFKEAAAARGLLNSDQEWDNCLHDAATYQMPRQLRDTFAFICVFCQPASPVTLWNKYRDDMILDYMRDFSIIVAENKAIHDIEAVLKQHQMSCRRIGLPPPIGDAEQGPGYNQVEEAADAAERIGKLNEKQKLAFDEIVAALEDDDIEPRCFYLDGPGGSGKTYLYKTLLAFVRGHGSVALPFATTGIAGTLLKGGRTVHSGFKLPVPLLDTSVSSMRLNSPEAAVLRGASLIIIDEITMLPKNGLRCIDKLLREVMTTDAPFGGKVFVIGGDFRQTLPVVARGTRTAIVESCIKSSRLWREFSRFSLTTNMRSEGRDDHNNWLLQVGDGTLPHVPGIQYENIIQIPQQMVETQDLIASTFGTAVQLRNMSFDELAKRVIVAPTNAQTLDMNRQIIAQLEGEATIYYSADSVDSEDPNDAIDFPPEFLHDQTPSGMPPHVLLLKKDVVIMLLRNLNPKKGLCNGTRMVVKKLSRNLITAEIISECNKGEEVIIPRIDLAPTDTTLPFILRRRQFPVIPAYAMTANKSQGQTFDKVGIDLQDPVFSHGQLYVALSRSRNPENIKVRIQEGPQQGKLLKDDRVFTKNVVFHEVFQM